MKTNNETIGGVGATGSRYQTRAGTGRNPEMEIPVSVDANNGRPLVGNEIVGTSNVNVAETGQTQPSVRTVAGRSAWSPEEETKMYRMYNKVKYNRRKGSREPSVWKRVYELWNVIRIAVREAYGVELPVRSESSIKGKFYVRFNPSRLLDVDPWERVTLSDPPNSVVLLDGRPFGESVEVVETEAAPDVPASEEMVEEAVPADETNLGTHPSNREPGSGMAPNEGASEVGNTLLGEHDASNPREHAVLESMVQEYERVLVIWNRKTVMWRKPLRFPKRVPEALWKQANILIESSITTGRILTLKDLNTHAYALGAAVKHELDLEQKQRKQSEKAWYEDRDAEVKNLARILNWIDVEVKRRALSRPLTHTQRTNLVSLRRKYGKQRINSPSRLLELKSMLKDALVGILRSVKRRKEDSDRKSKKFTHISRYLNPKDRDSPVLEPNAVRDYWHGIVGTAQRSQDSAAVRNWSSDVDVSGQVIDAAKIQEWWRKALAKAKANKAAGPDGIPARVWKTIPKAAEWVCSWLVKTVNGARINTPRWLAEGRVVLLPKKGDLSDPSNYRPIACLNTCYKLMTSVIERAIREQTEKSPILSPVEQVANRQGVWGCTQASIIDRMITGAATVGKGGGFPDLRVLFYDCRKAFDSVNRDHMFRVLEVARLNERLVHLLKSFTQNWTVKYELRDSGRVRRSGPLRVRRGLLQGDSLSPTWFNLCVAVISHAIRAENPGPTLRRNYRGGSSSGVGSISISHVFYMDDLKVYCPTESVQESMETLIPGWFGEIGLSINSSKSAAAGAQGNVQSELPVLGLKDEYKYLGIESGFAVNEVSAYDRMQSTLVKRISAILDVKEHTVGQRRNEVRSMAFPGAKYIVANVILASKQPSSVMRDMKQLDRSIRELIRRKGILHSKCSNYRIYLDCKKGGLGWASMVREYCVAVAYSAAYLLTSSDPWVSRAREYFTTGRLKEESTIFKQLLHIEEFLDVNFELSELDAPNDQPKMLARKWTKVIDEKLQLDCLEGLKGQARAGLILSTESPDIDHARSYMWLEKAWVNDKTYQHGVSVLEGTLLEGVNSHNVYEKCRACKVSRANICHIVSGCAELRKSELTQRHNNVTRWLYTCLQKCVDNSLPYVHYSHMIPALVKGNRLEVRYDVDIVTPAKLKHNRPDLVVFDRERKKIFVLEVSVAWYSAMGLSYTNKLHRYARNSNHEFVTTGVCPSGVNLAGELRKLYRDSFPNGVEVMPFIMGPTGELHSKFYSHLCELLETSDVSWWIEKIQRACVLGTDYTVRSYFALPKVNDS